MEPNAENAQLFKVVDDGSSAPRVWVVSFSPNFGKPRGVTLPKAAATIVLVHGAWTDASSWNKVIPILQTEGLSVIDGGTRWADLTKAAT